MVEHQTDSTSRLAEVCVVTARTPDQHGLEGPNVDPSVTLQVPAVDEVQLIVRVPTTSGQGSFVEQDILDEVMGANGFSGPEPSTP